MESITYPEALEELANAAVQLAEKQAIVDQLREAKKGLKKAQKDFDDAWDACEEFLSSAETEV